MSEPPDGRGDDWGGAEVPDNWGSPPPGPGWASPEGAPAGGAGQTPPGWQGQPSRQPPAGGQEPPGWQGHPGWAPPPGWQAQPGWRQPGSAAPPGPAWGAPPYGFSAPRPGVIPLRPLGLGEVLDGAFTTIRRYPRPTLGIAAIIVVVQQALSFAADVAVRNVGLPVSDGASTLPWAAVFTLPGVVAFLVDAALTALLAGMITIVVGDAVLGRAQISVAELWARARPMWWRLVGASILAGVLPVLGLAALIVGGVFLWGALALTMPALVLERSTVGGALRRSWALAVPDWWRVFGYRLLATIIATVVASIVVVPGAVIAGIAASSSGAGTSLGVPALAVVAVFSAIGSVFTQPFLAAVLALIYVDRRIRAEALDIALVAAASGQPPGPQPVPTAGRNPDADWGAPPGTGPGIG